MIGRVSIASHQLADFPRLKIAGVIDTDTAVDVSGSGELESSRQFSDQDIQDVHIHIAGYCQITLCYVNLNLRIESAIWRPDGATFPETPHVTFGGFRIDHLKMV